MLGWIIFLAVSLGILVLVKWQRKHFEFENMLKWDFKKSWIKPLRKLPKIPLIYMILQKSKIGIAFCDRFVQKHPKLTRRLKWPVIVSGFMVMITTFFTIIWALQDQIYKELNHVVYEVSAVALVLPFEVESKAVFYIPFPYWVMGIFVTIIIHEGGHALFIRYLKVPIESTGLAIMGILIPVIPAAYVKPDDKALEKESTSDKAWVYAAGSIFNIWFGILMFPLIILLMVIGLLLGYPFSFPVETGPFWWIFLFNSIQIIWAFNIGIGMMNLFPMLPLDGGHMMKAVFENWGWKEWTWKVGSVACLMLLLSTFLLPSLVGWLI